MKVCQLWKFAKDICQNLTEYHKIYQTDAIDLLCKQLQQQLKFIANQQKYMKIIKNKQQQASKEPNFKKVQNRAW